MRQGRYGARLHPAMHRESQMPLQEHLLGASPCPGATCRGLAGGTRIWGRRRRNGKGDQEVAKPLTIIPLFNAVKDHICRVIPLSRDFWRSLVQPPQLALRINQAVQSLSQVRSEALQGWRSHHLPRPLHHHLHKELLSLRPIRISPLAACCFSAFCRVSPRVSDRLGPSGAISSFKPFPVCLDDVGGSVVFGKQSY